MKYTMDERGHIRDETGSICSERLAMQMLEDYPTLLGRIEKLHALIDRATDALMEIAKVETEDGVTEYARRCKMADIGRAALHQLKES